MLYYFFIFLYNSKRIKIPPLFYIIPHIFFIVKEIERNKMKICAIICEYNPFHNGHLYQLTKARELSGADAVVCIMSGDFVQRGEAAILDKHTRARHAVMAGADIVIELPAAFATSNAELFAKGATKLLAAIPAVKTLCFGAETANAEAFLRAAKLLNNEPPAVSQKIKALTGEGASFAKARAEAWRGYIDTELLVSPNNILGLEYARAILAENADIEILPLSRVGGGYADTVLHAEYSSATAIRNAIQENGAFASQVPDFVLQDIKKQSGDTLETLEKFALLSRSATEIASVCDCTEGLENALKRAAEQSAPLAKNLTSARYTASRIRRIALQNLLKIDETLIRESLRAPLYLRVLAAKKQASEVLSALGESPFPLLIRAHDEEKLSPAAKRCFEADLFAEKIYALLYDPRSTQRALFL